MGRKRVGRSPFIVNRRLLLRRLQSFSSDNNDETVEKIVASLRSSFPEYRRYPDRVFTKAVLLLLDASQFTQTSIDRNENNQNMHSSQTPAHEDAETHPHPSPKKLKISDENEEGLGIETQLLHNMRLTPPHPFSGASSGSQKDAAMSDAVYEEKETTKLVRPSTIGEALPTVPDVKWEDVGGFEILRRKLNSIRKKYPRDYEESGFDLDTIILLYGPSGCGKTLISKAFADEAGAKFLHIKGPEFVSKYVEESESAAQTMLSCAKTCAPCVVFFDQVEALMITRRFEERSTAEQGLYKIMMDFLAGPNNRHGVFVIGATEKPDLVDPRFLGPYKTGKCFYVPLPSPRERGLILSVHAREKPVDASVDLFSIGQSQASENMNGPDLIALIHEAAGLAALRHSETIKTMHFEEAFLKVRPSITNEQKKYYDKLPMTLWRD